MKFFDKCSFLFKNLYKNNFVNYELLNNLSENKWSITIRTVNKISEKKKKNKEDAEIFKILTKKKKCQK